MRALARALPRELAHAGAGRRPSSKRAVMRRPVRDGAGAARLRKARRGGAGARGRSSKRFALLSLR
eukprot:32205-Alexandrium_andersonii.AAC.1